MRLLLSLYKKELKALYHAGKDSINKPFLKAIALSLARINYRLQNSSSELSKNLLQLLQPYIYRYAPAAGMVRLQGLENNTILKGSPITLISSNKKLYYFKTIYSVTFLPIYIKNIRFLSEKDNDSVLKVNFYVKKNSRCENLLNHKIRFYINMSFNSACVLYEFLFNQLSFISIKLPNNKRYKINNKRISRVGLNFNQSLLFDLNPISSAEQLFYDFFVFPEKFLFFDISLSSLPSAFEFNFNQFELSFNFTKKNLMLNDQVNNKSLLLNCTPIINLFDHTSEYIKFDHSNFEYKVIPQDVADNATLDIYDIKEVWQITSDGHQVKVPPFEGSHVSGENINVYWSIKRTTSDSLDQQSPEEIYLIFSGGDRNKYINTSYIKATLLCSHQSIELDAAMNNVEWRCSNNVIEDIELIYGPSTPLKSKINEDRWHFIALLLTTSKQLFNTSHSLKLLKQLLEVFSTSNESYRKNLLDSILSFNVAEAYQLMTRDNISYHAKGLKVSIAFDDAYMHFAEIFLFWTILTAFFSIKYSLYEPISFHLLDKFSNERASYLL